MEDSGDRHQGADSKLEVVINNMVAKTREKLGQLIDLVENQELQSSTSATALIFLLVMWVITSFRLITIPAAAFLTIYAFFVVWFLERKFPTDRKKRDALVSELGEMR